MEASNDQTVAQAAEHEDRHFSVDKVFVWLFIWTALEVGWGVFGPSNRVALWGGLLLCAFFKGWLIMVYFMHMKFEGWVVKSLVIPTPFLIMVIFGYVMPDVADQDGPLVYPVGAMLNPETGLVEPEMTWQKPDHGEGGGSGH